MYTGKIKFYKKDKGWGFITPDLNDPSDGDIFFHHTGLADTQGIADGVAVEYDLSEGKRGPQAVNIQMI